MVWVQDMQLNLLDYCKAEKVPWSGVVTNYSTSPFPEEIYERIREMLIEYEVVITRWPQYTLVLENVQQSTEDPIIVHPAHNHPLALIEFFAHFQCARSSPMLSSSYENETDPNLVHLPAADELSLNLLLEQFVKDKITLSDSSNNSSIFSATNYIKHWAHEEHDLKLITINELYDPKNDDEILLLCDGCVEPIPTYGGQSYYGCVPCKFFMHKGCAELPREIEHHLWPGNTLYANKYNEPFKVFYCDGCGVDGNGIFFGDRVTPSDKGSIHLHIGCVTLHKVIKHEAHLHQLDQVFGRYYICNACGQSYRQHKHRCKKCDFDICGGCIMKARTYKHRWDPHPLDLIYDVSMVAEHEHDFDCEYCSEDINPNYWFYHCSRCDLSFHTLCIEISSYRKYKSVKFGATNIIRDKLHPHGLTFVLNKKVRSCDKCGRNCTLLNLSCNVHLVIPFSATGAGTSDSIPWYLFSLSPEFLIISFVSLKFYFLLCRTD
ncbi:Phorbol-ester/DAG-type domain-containing protein [Heracleum sosnowskyi]|uniref:Phorbol-ester/DAG-type domain-containing protein n=1 Tax=Heracleum sosnowskyi TaxID=360622 RepID=A0AAD8H0P9_9APIA|nr:Phorbol-ester/DAG-type domain-containing protein [Heracleum sosnowskyi]KAK1358792.1 Phorbol-ester/DAG-type domain-containing protein [Heracleum sosnowskyi]